ncbi:hypothetical protein ALC57_00076 [Trachymyrmex cornetzi]|uniref:Zinc finger PHD-type domain-containing protein n=1 Tax=Trachymyrmex cornetzi TaxID=471704 RepID=A0A151K2U0_9HYME|nr:hypothetical protein ALC57_00076 [Trachymyrmex cornetzi]
MLSNPGVTVTIYHVGQFVKEAFLTSFTPHNLTQGFAKTGIYPLNSNIFSNEDFLPSYVTDRSLPTESDSQQQSEEQSNIVEVTYIHVTQDPTHVTEESESSPQLSTSTKNIVPLERIRPFPKAGPRKKVISKRKMNSAIITDTSEMQKILEKENESRSKKKKIQNMTTIKSIKSLRKKCEISNSSLNSQDILLHSNDSLNKISETKVGKISSNTMAISENTKSSDNNCCVCSIDYSISSEDWYQCKLCSGWAHTSCGNKGNFHFFCNKCF